MNSLKIIITILIFSLTTNLCSALEKKPKSKPVQIAKPSINIKKILDTNGEYARLEILGIKRKTIVA